MKRDDQRHLRVAIELSWQARRHGNLPFGALLVDLDGAVVLEAENTVVTGRDSTAHAEINLMRMASARFDAKFLEGCTLYTSTEPCAMCAGAIYSGNVRRVVFGLSCAEALRAINANAKNPTLTLSCREAFAPGRAPSRSRGPVPGGGGQGGTGRFWS